MAKQSLKQKAYDDIKNKILNCEFMPNAFLNEDVLCNELKVSRTPVRDALSRLEQERLITIIPKKGFFVAPLSIREINMAFEMRCLLEPYIIKNYCQNISTEDLDALYANVECASKLICAPNEQDFFLLDSAFHQIIFKQCDNVYIQQTNNMISNQNVRLRVLSGRTNKPRLESTVKEHFEIIDALSKGDCASAADAMKKHLANSKDASLNAFIQGAPSL